MTAEAGCRAALYLRLSRDDTGRAGESESIANQRRLLHDYALRQGWPVVAEYADDGVSGTTFDRPQFQKMLCEIPQRGINLILIKDLSRLGRDYLETGRYLERYFPEHGVRVVAVGDAVDTAHEDIFLPMRNYINELYARDTSGKIRAALQTKMKDGRFIMHLTATAATRRSAAGLCRTKRQQQWCVSCLQGRPEALLRRCLRRG